MTTNAERHEKLLRLHELSRQKGDKELQLKVLREIKRVRQLDPKLGKKNLTRQGKRTAERRRRERSRQNIENLRQQAQSSGIPLARDLPEIGNAPELNALSKEAFLASAGTLFSFDDKEKSNILQEQIGSETFTDAEGNLVAKMPSGGFFAINKPGFTGQDVAGLAATAGAFTPAGRARTLLGQTLGAAGTQAAIEAGQTGVGGDFDSENVGIAAVAPAAIRGALAGTQFSVQQMRVLADRLRANRYLIDPNTGLPSPIFESALKNRGMDFGGIMDDVDNLPAFTRQQSPDEVVDEIIKHQMNTGQASAALHRFKLVGGNVVDDPLGVEAVKQGFREGDIAAAKTAGKATKREMLRMLNHKRRIQADSSKALDLRPSDIPGDQAMLRFSHIRNRANDLRQELDKMAKREFTPGKNLLEHASTGGRLRGLQIDTEQVRGQFFKGLHDLQVNFDDAVIPPRLDFSNSLISEDKTSQRIIKSVMNILAKKSEIDAQKAHNVKRQLDTMLDFNRKSAAGLTDSGEKFAKQIRRSINNIIRDASPRYARVNDDLHMAITAMEDFEQALGGTVDVFAPNAQKAVGTTLRRLLSNVQSRTNLDNALTQIDDVASELGGVFDVDIRRLIQFNNTLDDRFGATARGSLKAEFESGLRSGPVQAAKDFAAKKAAEKIKDLRGISDTGAFNVMDKILKANPSS